MYIAFPQPTGENTLAKSTLNELLAQKAALEKTIEEIQRTERAEAIAKVKALMAEYGLFPRDIGAHAPGRNSQAGIKVAAKYRDKATGQTWSGRGLQPNWLRDALASGRTLKDFTV